MVQSGANKHKKTRYLSSGVKDENLYISNIFASLRLIRFRFFTETRGFTGLLIIALRFYDFVIFILFALDINKNKIVIFAI
jgi:hypothetical protein